MTIPMPFTHNTRVMRPKISLVMCRLVSTRASWLIQPTLPLHTTRHITWLSWLPRCPAYRTKGYRTRHPTRRCNMVTLHTHHILVIFMRRSKYHKHLHTIKLTIQFHIRPLDRKHTHPTNLMCTMLIRSIRHNPMQFTHLTLSHRTPTICRIRTKVLLIILKTQTV